MTVRPATLVFAHRGASGDLPEHTLAAYRKAIADGADGVECDVRLSRDGHLVCVHDALVDRTSDGRGRVSALTLAELSQLDFGSWHSSGVASPGVLTLDALVAYLMDVGDPQRPVRLLIETKHPSRFGGAVEEKVVAVLGRYGLARPAPGAPVAVSVMSFSPLAVRRMRALAPELPTVFLFEWAPPAVRDGRAPFGAGLLGPGVRALRARPEIVRRAQERGYAVYVWTVNAPDDIRFVADLGVDGLITDHPAPTRHHLP